MLRSAVLVEPALTLLATESTIVLAALFLASGLTAGLAALFAVVVSAEAAGLLSSLGLLPTVVSAEAAVVLAALGLLAAVISAAETALSWPPGCPPCSRSLSPPKPLDCCWPWAC